MTPESTRVPDLPGGFPTGELTLHGRVLPASNATFVGELDGVRVVYKPVAGERPLWDFPDGTLANREVAAYAVGPSARIADRLTRGRPAALQVPHRRGRVPVTTRALVRRAHAAGKHVHVWTIDDPAEMHELLDLGVDGLMTDRTDILRDVLRSRGLWEESS